MSDQGFQYAPPPAPQQAQPPQSPAPQTAAPQMQQQAERPGQQPRLRVPHTQNQQYLKSMQQEAESGLRYCRDCGQPVQPGSAVCVHCSYILNPQAFRRAQQLVGRRTGQQPVPPPVQQQPLPPPQNRQVRRQNGWSRSQQTGSATVRSAGAELADSIGDLVSAVLSRYDLHPQSNIPRRSMTPQEIIGSIPPQPAYRMPTRPLPQPGQPMEMPSLPETAMSSLSAGQQAQAKPGEQQQPDVTPEQIAAHSPDYHYDTRGPVYCPSCGAEVAHGACQCIHCNYVIDAAQYRLAQRQAEARRQLAEDHSAKLDPHDYVKSLLVPGYGKKMYEANRGRRPQIAEPCMKAGKINTAIMFVLAFLLLFFFGFLFGFM